jgi:creatinine amidohydrolase
MSLAEKFPAYRERYLPAFTAAAIAALPDKAWAPVILTTGAIEQHGPHLPVAVDSFLGQVWLNLVLQRLPSSTACYVAPPVTIGKSNEHTGFPGTLSISKSTLRLQVLAIARQLHDWGFRELVILNTHGGNSSVLNTTVAELRSLHGASGFRVTMLKPASASGLSAQEAAYGFHAGEFETSLMLATVPELVRMEAATCHYPARLTDPGSLRPECAPATFAWASQDVSPDGTMGDAPAATAAKGARWLEEISAALAADITRLHDEARQRALLSAASS